MSKARALTIALWSIAAILVVYVLLPIGLGYYEKNTSGESVNKAINPPVVPSLQSSNQNIQEFLALTNAERQKVGVKPLILDELLNESAEIKVQELANFDYHIDDPHKNKAGFEGVYYIADVTTDCIGGGSENLLWGITSVEQGVRWWMGSDSHREALLDEQYDYVGYAIKNGYVVQHMCDIDVN